VGTLEDAGACIDGQLEPAEHVASTGLSCGALVRRELAGVAEQEVCAEELELDGIDACTGDGICQCESSVERAIVIDSELGDDVWLTAWGDVGRTDAHEKPPKGKARE
jgi:hypothetical protein